MMEQLANREGGEDYKTFWESFGRNIKAGAGGGLWQDDIMTTSHTGPDLCKTRALTSTDHARCCC
jgi:hypothetical protein